jgi:hypothetical protein
MTATITEASRPGTAGGRAQSLFTPAARPPGPHTLEFPYIQKRLRKSAWICAAHNRQVDGRCDDCRRWSSRTRQVIARQVSITARIPTMDCIENAVGKSNGDKPDQIRISSARTRAGAIVTVCSAIASPRTG